MKQKKILIALLGTLSFVSFAQAEEIRKTPIKDARMENKNERQEIRGEIKTERKQFQDQVKIDREKMRAEVKDNREEFKTKIKEADTPEERKMVKEQFNQMKEENKDLRRKTNEEIKTRREELKTKFKAEIEESKIGRKEKLDTARKEKVSLVLTQALGRLGNAVGALENFDKKVSERIAKRKSEGVDVSKAESLLGVARTKLDEAKSAVEAVKSVTGEAVNATDGVSKDALKASIEKARDAVKSARDAYKEVITGLPKPVKTETSPSNEASN